MSKLTNELNKVLADKNFGDEENKLIMDCFKILLNHYGNKTNKLLEYIKSIGNLNDFKLITDIDANIVTVEEIEKLTSKQLEAKEQFPECFSYLTFCSKIGNKYVLDLNGDHILKLLGWLDLKQNSISIFNLPDKNVISFLHEYEHTLQTGFKISSIYFASAELEFVLREGDAMDLPLRVLTEDKQLQNQISNNQIPYFKEFHLFSNLKMLLGQEFIENWKSNSNMDFMHQVRNVFKEKFDENTLKEIISIIFLLKNIDSINDNYLQDAKENFNDSIKLFAEAIENTKYENIELDKKIKQLNIEITEEESKLNNSSFISSEVNKEKLECDNMISEYTSILNKIITFNGDKNKLKEFITSLGEEYDENINYELYTQEIINEYNYMLIGDRIEIQIRRDITNKLNNLKFKGRGLFERKEDNKKQLDRCISDCDAYMFSTDVLEKVVKRFNNYKNLTVDEKKCYNDNLLIEIQLLFNESFNKLVESSDNPKEFLEEYLLLRSSSFIIGKPVNNNGNMVYLKNQELINDLNNSRLQTLQSIFINDLKIKIDSQEKNQESDKKTKTV